MTAKHSPIPNIPSADTVTPRVSRETTDVPIRGTMALPSGETALVLHGGRVLVCKCPRVLDEYQSERLIAEVSRRLAPQAASLAAIGNVGGPDRETVMARRREGAVRDRDRRDAGILVDIPDEPTPEFTEGAIGLGMTDVERRR